MRTLTIADPIDSFYLDRNSWQYGAQSANRPELDDREAPMGDDSEREEIARTPIASINQSLFILALLCVSATSARYRYTDQWSSGGWRATVPVG